MEDMYLCDGSGCADPECACWANFCPECTEATEGEVPCPYCGCERGWMYAEALA